MSARSVRRPQQAVASLSILLQQSVASLDQLDPRLPGHTLWSSVLVSEDPAGTNPYDLARWLPISANLVQQGGFSTLDLNFNAPVTFGGNSHGEILEQAGTSLTCSLAVRFSSRPMPSISSAISAHPLVRSP
jgi:hypothetical protein